MAFHTIWSVDLGKSSLKAVKLSRDRNNIEILAVDKVDYPVGKTGVDAATHMREALEIFRSRNHVTEPVAVIHPGQGTLYRSIKVPASDDKKLDAMVGYEAAQQIPFPLDEVIWDYHVTQKQYLPGEERDVSLFAVRREAIDDFLLDFANEDLNVEVVSISYLGLLNFVAHDLRPEEPSIVLDIGAAHTDLVLIDEERFWVRPLPHSGNDITNAIAQRFKLSFADAEKLKVEASKVPQQAVKIFQAVIQPKLRELVGEIHRSIGYYRSQAGEVAFKNLYLLGNGAKIVGIKKFLEEQLGVRVHRVQSINHFRINRDVNLKLLQANLPAFGAALGCAVQALGAGACEVDLVPREEKLRKELARKQKHVFIAAGILAVLMILAWFLINRQIGEVEGQIAEAERKQKTLSQWSAKIAEVEKGSGNDAEDGGLTAVVAKQTFLTGIARSRALPLLGLRAFHDVLGSFRNREIVEITVPEEDTTRVESARQEFVEGRLLEALWVPHLSIQATTFPEPSERAGSRATAAPNAVPAYRFTAYVVIKKRPEGDVASYQHIRSRFAEPLRDAHQLLGFIDPSVTVEQGAEIPAIFYPEGRSASAAAPQEGGPYYGALVTWLVYKEKPVEEKPANEDGEDGDDDAS